MSFLLQHLLTESAQHRGAATAVVCGSQQLSYEELDRLSSHLAGALIDSGMEPGGRVGIYLRKSVESIVAVFGILKAGGVYVPIDPLAPPKRAAYVVTDSGLRHLVTTRANLADLVRAASEDEAMTTPDVAIVDDGDDAPCDGWAGRTLTWAEIERGTPRSRSAIDSDLAYILYTSGSTGRPKGVMIQHRASLSFVRWAMERFAIHGDDVVANHAPLHFDLSTFDIFAAIGSGATVVLVPERLSTFPAALAKFIEEERISVWYSVPSALTLLMRRGKLEGRDLSRLRLILFAGEVFPIKHLRTLQQLVRVPLFNLYGPTETNVCTYYEVPTIESDRSDSLPIGKAIANYHVFALNEEGEIAAVGEKGELYARGTGVMAGYWGDREKTGATLVANPVSDQYEERVCRTGDIVILGDDGEYRYVGRRDHMVKSRGYRIELGEVEAALHSHPSVRQAVVVPVADEEITNALHAFAIAENPELTPGELQKHCQSRIPKYMIPTSITFCDQLPETSTGKVDRVALQLRAMRQASEDPNDPVAASPTKGMERHG